MKILVSLYGKQPGAQSVRYKLTDSDWQPIRKPFFLPDFDERFVMTPVLVARISRLGKGIPSRFAYRYREQAAVGLLVRAAGLYEHLRREGLPVDPAVAFDSAAMSAPFRPLEEVVGPDIAVLKNDEQVATLHTEECLRQIDAAIPYFANTSTLKTGDYILAGAWGEDFAINENDLITLADVSLRVK